MCHGMIFLVKELFCSKCLGCGGNKSTGERAGQKAMRFPCCLAHLSSGHEICFRKAIVEDVSEDKPLKCGQQGLKDESAMLVQAAPQK